MSRSLAAIVSVVAAFALAALVIAAVAAVEVRTTRGDLHTTQGALNRANAKIAGLTAPSELDGQGGAISNLQNQVAGARCRAR